MWNLNQDSADFAGQERHMGVSAAGRFRDGGSGIRNGAGLIVQKRGVTKNENDHWWLETERDIRGLPFSLVGVAGNSRMARGGQRKAGISGAAQF